MTETMTQQEALSEARNGLFGAYVQFSEWPEGELFEETKEWLLLIC